MSIPNQILSAYPDDVMTVAIHKDAVLYGEPAVEVVAILHDGRTVTGTFTSHPRSGFGGVTFAGPKDVVGLMTAKIRAVLDGSAE